jgi:hypothetical protein
MASAPGVGISNLCPDNQQGFSLASNIDPRKDYQSSKFVLPALAKYSTCPAIVQSVWPVLPEQNRSSLILASLAKKNQLPKTPMTSENQKIA